MIYSLCVSLLINVLFISADGPDSVCRFLFVHEMMGNGENDCTSEGCKLGKARLRTNWPYGSSGWEGGNWLLATRRTICRNCWCLFLRSLLLTNETKTSSLFTLTTLSAVCDFCAALKAWLFEVKRMETGPVLKGTDPDAWITQCSCSQPLTVMHVLYPLCKVGLKHSAASSQNLYRLQWFLGNGAIRNKILLFEII